jgi:glucans biosynthesis protein
MTRRILSTLFTTFIALSSGMFLGASPAQAFGFDEVAELAQRDAAQAWLAPIEQLPDALSRIDYDGLRDIRYRPDRAVWRAEGLPFELQFFHLGLGNRTPVAVHEIVAGQARPLNYDASAWNYGRNTFDTTSFTSLGFAGLRVHHALNNPAYKDELVVFLGASYFRALGRGQQYGLSARALAIDTVGAPAGAAEEFPRFKAFWIERPAADATTLTIHALLDSPRATGAYRFVLRPGDNTTMDVQARVFIRALAAGERAIATLGIAPLTSMFQHGENQPRPGDYRPQVHDSDGLLVAAAAVPGAPVEWLWRPLFNPAVPLVSSFVTQQLKGFGLMQRERRFSAYEDSEARYERRPSAWVEPLSHWGPGRVELLLLPTADETHDNVAAYWVPAALPAPGEPLDLSWRVHWQGDKPTVPPAGHTVQSRLGWGWVNPANPAAAGEMLWHIDFDGPALRALPAGTEVEAVVTAGAVAGAVSGAVAADVAGKPSARVLEARAYPHPQGGYRLQLRVQRSDSRQPTELRAFLRHAGSALTETWSALIPQELP